MAVGHWKTTDLQTFKKIKKRKKLQEQWFDKIEKYNLPFKKHWWYKTTFNIKREKQRREGRRVFLSWSRGGSRDIEWEFSELMKVEKPLAHNLSRREKGLERYFPYFRSKLKVKSIYEPKWPIGADAYLWCL